MADAIVTIKGVCSSDNVGGLLPRMLDAIVSVGLRVESATIKIGEDGVEDMINPKIPFPPASLKAVKEAPLP
jgi:hypothetical protein